MSFTITGTKSVKGPIEQLPHKFCESCNEKNCVEYNCYYCYFHTFFVPIFPMEKSVVSQCLNCGEIIERDPAVDQEAKDLLKKTSYPWWMWIGMPIIIAGVIGIICDFL